MPKIQQSATIWMDWPDDQMGGRIEVAEPTGGDLAEISDKTFSQRTVLDPDSGTGLYVEQKNNSMLDRELTAIKFVKNWENFTDHQGNPMECTPENLRIWARDDEFMLLVKKGIKAARKKGAEIREKLRKNLKTLPSGSPATDGKAARSAERPTSGQADQAAGTPAQ